MVHINIVDIIGSQKGSEKMINLEELELDRCIDCKTVIDIKELRCVECEELYQLLKEYD